MNKTEFLNALAEKSGVGKKEVTAVFEAMQDTIVEALKNDDKITITGFGTFQVKHRNARTCRNPQTGDLVKVEAKDVPAFKPGSILKEALN